MSKLCLHCQEPSPHSDFCCIGCQGAYALIQGAGLEAVYTQAHRQFQKPSENSQHRFEIFDHSEFLRERTTLHNDLRRGTFAIEGLMCAACVWLLEQLPKIHAGVLESRIDFGRSVIHLTWKDSPEGLSQIAKVISRLGYGLSSDLIDIESSRIPRIEWIRFGIAGASAAGSMHIGFILIGSGGTEMDSHSAQWVGLFSGLVALPALTFSAVPFFRNFWAGLKLKMLSTDSLVVASLLWGSAISLTNALRGHVESYFDALSMIIFLLLGGRILIRLATDRATRRPIWFARKDGQVIPASSLKLQENYELKANEICPCDAILASDSAWVDLSAVTGENLPIQVFRGQKLPQGAQAISPLIFTATETHSNSWLEKQISNLRVSEAPQTPKPFETIFSLSILALALLVFFCTVTESLPKAIAILIVTCPCALQLSVPLALAAFRTESFRRGVSVLRPEKLLHFRPQSRIAFDKTGTLTQPQVISQTLGSQDVGFLNSVAFELALRSDHPVSKAIVAECFSSPRSKIELREIQEVAGEGMRGICENQRVSLRRSLDSAQMSSSLFIGESEVLRFNLSESLRPEAKECLRDLKQNQNFQTWVLSGDRKESLVEFARKTAGLIDRVEGELSPAQKAERLSPGDIFVGDGLNDALGMKAAGLSIGFAGSAEANLRVADVYLMKKDLRLIPAFVEALKKTQSTVNLNYTVSILYNVICIGLVLQGFLGPVLCAIFMPLSSLSVLGISVFRRKWSTETN